MTIQLYILLIAQFLSAFADNAILFTIIALVMQSSQFAYWYVPALQGVFLMSFVFLAPWAGALADNYAKSSVLLGANLIKAVGTLMLLIDVQPLIAYCIVGVGAAFYSPAKYGILPELVNKKLLIKANSWVEGSTILAILSGMIIGAVIADYSILWALICSFSIFVIASGVSLLLPKKNQQNSVSGIKIQQHFYQQIRLFFGCPRSRFMVLVAVLFWAIAVTIRVIIVVWAPLVLMTQNTTEIAGLTLFLALGIIIGSILVPYLIPLDILNRVIIPTYLMAIFIIILGVTKTTWSASMVLFSIGIFGGMIIVPINAALQELGQRSIGSGSAVALQGFFQNIAMLVALTCYTFVVWQQVNPVTSLIGLGLLALLATFLISLQLPKNQNLT